MSTTAATVSCVNHRRRDKVASCGTCGNALCADCVVHTPVGVKCRSCTGVKGGGVSSGIHVSAGDSRHAAGSGDGRRGRPLVLVAAGVVVLALAAYALASRGSAGKAPEEAVGTLTPTVSERTSEFLGAGGQRLGGTLTLPAATASQADVPAVLLVAGLGAVDRDSVVTAGTPDALRDALAATLTVSALGSSEPMFKDLSQTLANAGIASFRYDKRGTAASKLKPSLDDEVADARAALDFLAQRKEVGSAPIGVLGHDEGGVVAMRAAAGNPRVKALVAVSTPGRPLADALADDLARSRGATTGEEFRAAAAGLKTTGKVPAPASLSPVLQALFPAGQESYLTSILSVDPQAEAKAVSVPALVVRGGGDQSTTTAEATTLAAAMGPAGDVMVGGPDIDRNLALPGEGHVHSNTVTAPKSNEDPELGGRLTTWLQARLHT